MNNFLAKVVAGAIVLLCLAFVARAQAPTDIFHDPFLNWDFTNFTNDVANDFEIIVDTPNWQPSGVYTGFFPKYSTSPVNGGQDTKVSWWGRDVPPGAIAHVGLGMQGSGRILDAYWTRDGQRIPGGSLAIVYELTRVRPSPIGAVGEISMLLQAVRGPDVATEPVTLRNIRAFANLPAVQLGLDDLTADLDLRRLANFEVTPGVRETPDLPVDSFFDVFITLTQNISPDYEALLTADVFVGDRQIGRFWNLNPQSPEPGALGLLVLGCVAMLSRRR